MKILGIDLSKIDFSKKFAISIMIGYFVIILLSIFLITFCKTDLIGVIGVVTPIPLAVIGFFYKKAEKENVEVKLPYYLNQEKESEG
jgi:sensor histidine kinase YesM